MEPSSQPEVTMPPKKIGQRFALTDDEKQKLVEGYEATPKGEGEVYCKKHGISSPLIAYWRQTLGQPEKFSPASTPKRPIFTADYKRKIIEEMKTGKISQLALSQREGISRSVVGKWMDKAGVPSGPTAGYPPEKKAAVIADLARMPAEAVAAKHEIHFSTVYAWKRQAAGKPARRRTKAEVIVEATQRALEKVNNGTPPLLVAPTDLRSAGQFIREALRKLRSLGIDIASITVDGDQVTIRYNSQETIEL